MTLVTGHAVEVRLYAEDPRTFLPQAGRIERLVLPEAIRVDAGVEEGDEVALAYDPLIAKLIAHGPTRDDALDRLEAALAETEVEGVTTNLPFLRWLVAHPDVRAGGTTTAFLVEHPPLSTPPARTAARGRGAARGASTCPRRRRRRRPTSTTAAHGHGRARRERRHRADARHRDQGARRARATRCEARQPLVVLEAMKMETPLIAPYDATCARCTSPRATGAGGAVLVELED